VCGVLRTLLAGAVGTVVGYAIGSVFGYRAAVTDYVENDGETLESMADEQYDDEQLEQFLQAFGDEGDSDDERGFQ